ncbi:MAG: dihydroxy-acid dehydratase [Deltaproteobacteria bacterium]|nr:dihydroxy-acid dehydratase [Deltaproteobacteria bacterium]MBW1948220.1 dihydroxy-acid dehydratase [Deltaproteobacteria bacterium]MBW2006566.1 dihydroxy-acid dehydratase [Deltaproteobacteria bacterium]MBW2346381.1 dihydroxy-acid dehydratase [Deltaproteobacteria bacterium]RLB40005.1 MAG: dihydroxy-acid dehydratase [Deltaproteobacteria bacterium]
MRSEILKRSVETLPHRALLMSAGVKRQDLESGKPFIGVANSFTELIPGHIHLNELTAEVKRGIREAGGVPFEWGVPGICDGIAMFVEMRLSLPSREHIADNIEIMVLSHSLDGWVGVTACDKITPGMLMAAGRLNLPAVILTGGPMKANIINGKKHHPVEGFGIVGQVKAGKMSPEEAEGLLPCMTCGAGSCVGLYTANTMAVVSEVLGMSLPGCSTTLALDPLKKDQAYQSGKRIVDLVRKEIRPRDIMTENAFANAIRVDMAMGGSTNAVLHIPAIAKEGGILIEVGEFDRISRETPNLCSIIPSGEYEMADLDAAGGIPAVLNRLMDFLEESPTITGASITQIAAKGRVKDELVIRPLDRPYHEEGGIAVLRGNIANSAIIKQTAVQEEMMVHRGPARVFYSEKDLLEAIGEGTIKEGDVVVLPFQGPAGAPGMPEMLTPTDAIKGAGYKRVALLTDGRFSGATTGPCIGHVEMEAYNGGAIGAVRDGDIIAIDIPNRRLDVELDNEQMQARLKETMIPERTVTSILGAYRERFSGKNCYGR